MKPANGVEFKPETLVLLSVAAVFQNDERHTQRMYARREDQTQVEPWGPEAFCFCLDGAIDACICDLELENRGVLRACWQAAQHATGGVNLIAFNDRPDTSPEMVVDVCYRAAEYAEYGAAT